MLLSFRVRGGPNMVLFVALCLWSRARHDASTALFEGRRPVWSSTILHETGGFSVTTKPASGIPPTSRIRPHAQHIQGQIFTCLTTCVQRQTTPRIFLRGVLPPWRVGASGLAGTQAPPLSQQHSPSPWKRPLPTRSKGRFHPRAQQHAASAGAAR